MKVDIRHADALDALTAAGFVPVATGVRRFEGFHHCGDETCCGTRRPSRAFTRLESPAGMSRRAAKRAIGTAVRLAHNSRCEERQRM